MSHEKVVLVVHPESRMRILLRSVLQDHGRQVLTDHSLTDVLADRSAEIPAVILLDRSFVAQDGVDVWSLFRQKRHDTETVLLPEGLESADRWRDCMIQVLRHLDRMLVMKPTRELLSVSQEKA
jgi:DNA-binding response OmpR family regulator